MLVQQETCLSERNEIQLKHVHNFIRTKKKISVTERRFTDKLINAGENVNSLGGGYL